MFEIVALNLLTIIFLAVIGGWIFSSKDSGSGLFGFIWTLWALFCLSVFCWVIYVAVHFLQKVW